MHNYDMNSIQTENLFNLCHFCLKSTTELKPIPEETTDEMDSNGKSDFCIMDFVSLITNLKIPSHNEFPKSMCYECADLVDSLLKFRLTCIESFRILNGMHASNDYNNDISKDIKLEMDDNISMNVDVHLDVDPLDEIDTDSNDSFMEDKPIVHEVPEVVKTKNNTRPKKIKKEQKTITTEAGSTTTGDFKVPEDMKPRKKRVYPTIFCEICGESTQSLSKHLRTHTNERPFPCPDCDKWFKQRSHLKTHSYIHTNLRPFKCNLCDKGYNDNSTLLKHKITHTGEKKHICKICERPFGHSSSLAKHMKTHIQNRRYECEVCRKTFLTATDHKQHLRIHTGEKPYDCKMCDKSFRTSGMRRVHETRVHALHCK